MVEIEFFHLNLYGHHVLVLICFLDEQDTRLNMLAHRKRVVRLRI